MQMNLVHRNSNYAQGMQLILALWILTNVSSFISICKLFLTFLMLICLYLSFGAFFEPFVTFYRFLRYFKG
jgi:ABC-type polysaccharide/polyol phosphate export permease